MILFIAGELSQIILPNALCSRSQSPLLRILVFWDVFQKRFHPPTREWCDLAGEHKHTEQSFFLCSFNFFRLWFYSVGCALCAQKC